MRITNSMISARARQHIATAKNNVLIAEDQYTTGKKIQRPSDDPVIASRALKFRNTYSQLTQYLEKNVQDAKDWMDSTEGAMDTVRGILKDMKTRLDEGANGPLDAKQRASVLEELRQYASSIFEDCANSDYAGRYLFTGYRTDTSLLFPTDTNNLQYEIKEDFTLSDVARIRDVISKIAYEDGATAEDYAAMEAKIQEYYRIQLAYSNCSNTALDGEDADGNPLSDTILNFTVTNKDGTSDTYKEGDPGVIMCSREDFEANMEAYLNDADNKIIYIYDAGEVVLTDSFYSELQNKDAKFSVEYVKKEFEKNSIRPEMYFKCNSYDTISNKLTKYADPSGQNIDYEINLRQEMTVNTQAKDAFSTAIYRHLDYIARMIDGVNDVENRLAEVEKKIAETDPTDTDTLEALEKLKASLKDEEELRVSAMNTAFGAGLTMINNVSQTLDVQIAHLGANYRRLELTEDKLMDQKLTAEDQMSDNEDIELSDAIINLTQADYLYSSALSATAKILGNSLLNYI